MKKSKGSKIVLLLIMLLLIILIVAGGAYAYIATDLLKTPDMLFKKYLFSEAVEISKFNVGPYKDAYMRMENEPAEIKIVGKNEFNPGSTQYFDEDEEQEEQYLETTLTLKLDNPNKNRAVLVDAKLEDEDYLNLELLTSKDAAGIYVDGLHDKYITLENRDFKKIAKTFNVDEEIISNIPDNIPKLSISNEQKERIVNIISDIVSNELDSIDSNSYAQESYIIDDYNGEKFEGNKYTLTISSTKLNEIIYNITNNFVKNEDVKSLLKTILSEDLINNAEENLLETVKNEVKINEETTVKISVYTHNRKALKIDVTVDDEVMCEMYILNKETSSSMQIRVVSPKTESNQVASECLVNINSSFQNDSGDASIEQKITYNKKDIKALKAKEEEENDFYDEDEIDETYKNSTLTARATTTVENGVITSKITTPTQNKDKQTSTYTMKFGNDVKVPTLKSDNMIVINDYTSDEFGGLFMELLANAAKTAQEKPNTLIGTVFGFVSSFSNMLMPSEYGEEISIDQLPTNDLSNTEENNSGEMSTAEINQGKADVDKAVLGALSRLLKGYKDDLEDNPDANLGEYLSADKIQKEAGSSIKKLEIVDGETIRCEYKNSTYFVKIYINGDNWSIDDSEVLYSEDGTIESAK